MPVLGVTQIISWGSIFYTPVLIVPLIANEHGWSMTFAMGGFSVALLAAGLIAPAVGRSIDHFGGHVTMTAGSLTGALGLVLIGYAIPGFVLGVALLVVFGGQLQWFPLRGLTSSNWDTLSTGAKVGTRAAIVGAMT